MNVDVVGRVRPSIRGEGPHTLQTDGHNKLASRPGASYFQFQQLHRQDASNFDVFHRTVMPQVELCLAGFNTCLLLIGESGSGKSYTIAGETMSKSGIVPLSMDHIFAKIGEDERYIYDKQVGDGQTLNFSMYEIYNELIQDLNQVPGARPNYLEISENAEKGTFVKGANKLPVSNAAEGTALFRQAWARRTETFTDYGPAKNHSTIVIQLDITLQVKDSPLPNRSRMTFVVLPGAEKLSEDQSELRLREGPTLNRSLLSLGQLVASLANQPYPDRIINYGESTLTSLMRDELGGNCKTRALVCLPPQPDAVALTSVLQLCHQLIHVLNYPLLNDPFAQMLMTQYRAHIISLQKDLGYGAGLPDASQIGDSQQELRRMHTENLGLRDQNERLHHKLEQLQGKFGSLATTKTDLSAQLLMTEEEKLRVSKTLVDMKIENNKLKEECEVVKFELTNKILQLENDFTEMEVDRDRHAKSSRNSKEKLSEVEKDRKDLADEYVALKSNYLSVAKAHEGEVKRVEELSVEMLNLVNAKAALMRQAQTLHLAEAAQEDGYLMDPDAEIDRVKAVISRYSSSRLRPGDYKSTDKDRENVERTLFGNQQRFDGEVNKMRTQYDDDQRKLQRKINGLNKDIIDTRKLARDRQKKISELNAQLITTRNERDYLQTTFNRLQHKMKDVNEDFRSRLVKYVEDVAVFVDGNTAGSKRPNPAKLKVYVDDMLKDLKRAHKIREQQLSDAAQGFKQRLHVVVARHEELLVTYRELRLQVEAKGFDDLDLGPDETKLHLSEEELTSSQEKEIQRLTKALAVTQTDLNSISLRNRVDAKKKSGKSNGWIDSDTDSDKWAGLRKQLREFTLNTQQDLEQERAELLTQNSILEQEVHELMDYIDTHLARYKEEIVKLRRQLGLAETSGFTTPPQPHSYRNHRR